MHSFFMHLSIQFQPVLWKYKKMERDIVSYMTTIEMFFDIFFLTSKFSWLFPNLLTVQLLFLFLPFDFLPTIV